MQIFGNNTSKCENVPKENNLEKENNMSKDETKYEKFKNKSENSE